MGTAPTDEGPRLSEWRTLPETTRLGAKRQIRSGWFRAWLPACCLLAPLPQLSPAMKPSSTFGHALLLGQTSLGVHVQVSRFGLTWSGIKIRQLRGRWAGPPGPLEVFCVSLISLLSICQHTHMEYTHTHMLIHMCAFTHVHRHACARTYIHTSAHMYIHSHTRTHTWHFCLTHRRLWGDPGLHGLCARRVSSVILSSNFQGGSDTPSPHVLRARKEYRNTVYTGGAAFVLVTQPGLDRVSSIPSAALFLRPAPHITPHT